VLYSGDEYEFYIDLYFDRTTAVFLILGGLLSLLVAKYSTRYLHREEGYRRFFANLMAFYAGFNLTILAGNFETLFFGWELLGLSSFLLIAFYRDRILPVKNAVRVFSIYRIGDIGLLLAMWMSHHFWGQNITFEVLNEWAKVESEVMVHPYAAWFLSIGLLAAATAKSAQFPFSTWLPRAMEGPTPSSAIFYGSLSVHIGVYLLIRTFPFWSHLLLFKALVVVLGLITAILAAPMARVQSSLKAQIAYSSIVQIGIMFIEVALGFHTLALVHLVGNAFLRTYQLLVSPSAVTYMIREQFYHELPSANPIEKFFPVKLRNTLYLLSVKEWQLEDFLYNILVAPFKKMGKGLSTISYQRLILSLSVVLVVFLLASIFISSWPAYTREIVATACMLFAFLLTIKAFTERELAERAWVLILFNHFFVLVGISINEHLTIVEWAMYLSGVAIAFIFGWQVIRLLRENEGEWTLFKYNGFIVKYPFAGGVLLLACLTMAGFPISPTFIGEDLLFSHVKEAQPLLVFFMASAFVVEGLSLIRLYARTFLGHLPKTLPKGYKDRFFA
jgi:NADH:ubiquinone oxidoreductase subunit 5 (subunit L)/multisubunit Na+/H+ antiporter MnhA subunit